MHKGHQALPRLRPSISGSVSSRTGSRWSMVWYLLLVSSAVLVCGGYITFSGYLWWSSTSVSDGSSRGSQDYFSSKPDFEPVAAAVSALQRKAARAAVAAAAGITINIRQQDAQKLVAGGVEAIQQLQQGADVMAANLGSVGSMTRVLREQINPTSSMVNASAAAKGVTFFDASAGIRSTTDAMQRRPHVHGYVSKAGMTDITAWMGNNSDARLDSFISWRINRTKRGGAGPATADSYTCAAADHPKVPFPGCHVFVNHKYKYIYIRSPKAASTSIVNVLGECDNKATRGYNSSSCMVLHFYWNSTELESDYMQRMWKDYFVFGFARNPWRRAYSLYKYLHSNGCMPDDKLKDNNCRVSWPEFCADPWSAGDALHDKGCIKRSKSYLYFHMQDQYHCMRTADGNWSVDYIGRVDEPNEDWAEVVKRLNANRVKGVPEIPVTELEQKNVRAGNVKDPYTKPGAEQCFDSVSRWYACDVEHYGFASLKQTAASVVQ